MTTPDLADLRHHPVTTLDDLGLLWRAVLRGDGGPAGRRLWVVMFDTDGTPAPVVVPVDDLPAFPGVEEVEEVDALRRMLDDLPVASLALLLSRPGLPSEQDGDRAWADALAPLSPEWPVHLATADPDEPSGPPLVQALPRR